MAKPYLLLTPGPLTTSQRVKEAMLSDWCTWDDDYLTLTTQIRQRLTALATENTPAFTTVLMQGSGTFGIESVFQTAIADDDHVLIVANGAYGARMGQICSAIGKRMTLHTIQPTEVAHAAIVAQLLDADASITHVAVVHCETTTGILNPIDAIGALCAQRGRILIVDAMSSFGGIPFDVETSHIDWLVSSSNKCLQGVPGFSFVVARRSVLVQCSGRARSLALDLFAQWTEMETKSGKWRFTSPTHTVHAFFAALEELAEEGGISARHKRYEMLNHTLVEGMIRFGFQPVIEANIRSPFITAFHYPSSHFSFTSFYNFLKQAGFVIYPGKLGDMDTFRIGTIGHMNVDDIVSLLKAVEVYVGGAQ
ncbi:MAG: 2-aminoethylphosphonate--pyruvate transaminase [Bacilli bacterium]